MLRRLASVHVSAIPIASLVLACSGSGVGPGASGTGGVTVTSTSAGAPAHAGGAATGGGNNQGGLAAGGTNRHGGATTGGAANPGGATTGGNTAQGGSSNGGSSQGGASTGGAVTAGANNQGGSSKGGAAAGGAATAGANNQGGSSKGGTSTGGAAIAGANNRGGAAAGGASTGGTSGTAGTQPIADRTIEFSTADPGVSKGIPTWGLDTAWFSEANIRRGVAFMGAERVDVVRVSFTPTAALVNGDLQVAEADRITKRLDFVDLTNPNTAVVINEDAPTVDPSFKDGSGNIIPARWAELIDVTAMRCQERGRKVLAVAPFNEPDYDSVARGSTKQAFYDVAGELLKLPRYSSIRISGGNTLNTDQANPWYDFLKARLQEGNTHQLAGNFDNYASFFQKVVANGHVATNDELHNVMEAIVGVEYGMQTAIWWGTAERARGEFVRASDGKRLGYAEHRPNWTAAAVYRAPDGKVQAFGGSSERQAITTTYRFVSKDREVFYDGYGPQREYTLVIPGGTGYQVDQPNSEKVVNITWGDDIQPPINGRYVLLNRNSGKVMEVANAATDDGANIRQGTATGATNQQWDITPLDPRAGGDYSYSKITAVHSGKAPDVFNFSLDNGGNVAQWTLGANGVGGVNQQWYLEYAGDGWFYICSKLSAKCLNVLDSSVADGANIVQWDNLAGANQKWRLLPIGAPIEFVAPSAPTGLLASASARSVRITWNASPEPDVTSYTVFRSNTPGGPYDTIARDVSTTNYVDNTATTGGPYYYKVKAVDQSLNRSAYSGEASAAPTG